MDEIGISALHNAARRDHWHIARLLLEKNASPWLQDGNCATPLRLAVREGHKQIARLFLECDPPANDHVEMETHMLIRVAAALGHTEIVQLFLYCNTPTLVPDGEETALHLAAAKGHHDVCELLLSHDKALDRSLWARIVGPSLDVDAKDYPGNIPFSWAVEKGHERTVEVFLRNYPDLSKSCDRYRELHFHKAVRTGKIELVRIFLSCGTDIEMKDNEGRRVLHVAIIAQARGYYAPRSTELIQLLLENGAAVDATDKYGRTPEFYANDSKTRMLLRNNPNPCNYAPKEPSTTEITGVYSSSASVQGMNNRSEEKHLKLTF